MRSLIERQGGVATVAPSMREIPIDQNPAAFAFAEALFAGTIDAVVFLTGVGARSLLEVLESRHSRDEIVTALAKRTIVVRGPKPVAVLRDWNIRIDHRAPEPNTWRELLATIDAEVPVSGRTVAIQEYGLPNEELYTELRGRGATVTPVPVYRWELPDDVAPLQAAIEVAVADGFDLFLFTSAQQVHHVLEVAEGLGLKAAWLDAVRRGTVGSIGPTCSEALAGEGVRVDFEAAPPKMGQLVKGAIELAATRSKSR